MYPLYLVIPTSIIALLVLCYFLKSLFPKPKVGDYHNKYVLITGCDTGFGKSTAIRLDKLGFRVIAGCLTKEGQENLQSVCSDRLVSVLMDVTNSKQIQDVFVQVKNMVSDKGIWAVINNAGLISAAPLEWFRMEDCKKLADVNLWGLIEVTKTFLPLVKKAEGRIINISSVAGLISGKFFGPYSITKYGVEAFSDALRREMAEWKVKVFVIEPAQFFRTPLVVEMYGKKLRALWEGSSEELREQYDGEEGLERARKGIKTVFDETACSNIDLVVDGFVDAVTLRDPPPRWMIGPLAKFFGVLALLPTALQDTILGRTLIK